MESAGIKISSEWGVPKYLVRSRMIHLGWWEAQGALNYIQKNSRDGYYIRPFVFDHESCPTTTYTFFIQPVDAFRLYESNQEYRAQIDSGEYVYAEGHVCLSQHVKQTKVGPQLTQWANCHIDECCLRFQNIYVLNEHYEFRLESINSDEEYNRHYNEFIARGKALSPREATARQDSLIASLPHTPGEALKHLMKQKSVTQEELAEKALVSISTVKRWLKEEFSYTPEHALRIIVALSLPPWLSGWFLDMAKVPLQHHGIHLIYREIISCRYMDSLRTNNSSGSFTMQNASLCQRYKSPAKRPI